MSLECIFRRVARYLVQEEHFPDSVRRGQDFERTVILLVEPCTWMSSDVSIQQPMPIQNDHTENCT